VLRTRAVPLTAGSAIGDRDAALCRDAEDLACASAQGFKTAVSFEDERSSRYVAGLDTLVLLGSRFGYLADGDIIGMDTRSLRMRVLYRRESKHNSFLVTERCNHYCLMCSQPPRDVDDGWILDEIGECVGLIDPVTNSIGFTGGEPLLEWRRFIPLLAAIS